MGNSANADVIVRSRQKGAGVYDQVEHDLKRLTKSAGVATAALAAAAVGGIALMSKEAFKTQDALAKQADALHVNTIELQAYRQEGQLAGLSQGELDKFLQQSTKRLGEFAQTGSGAAAPMLKELGLNTKELLELDPIELFNKYGESIRGMSSRAEQAAASSLLFGDRSGKLLNLIDKGGDSFAKTVAEVERYGIALNRVDAAKVEQANDALFLAKERARGIGNVIAARTAPVVTALANEFIASGNEAGALGDAVDKAMNIAAIGVGIVADSFRGWQLLIAGARAGITELAADAAELADKINPDADFFGGAKAIGERLGFREQEEKTTNNIAENARATADEMHRQLSALAASAKPSETIAAALQQARIDAAETAQSVERQARTFQDLRDQVSSTKEETNADDRAAKEQERLETQLARQLESVTLSFAAREQVEALAFARRAEIVHANYDQELISKEHRDNLIIGLEKNLQAKLTKIHSDGMNDRQKFAAKSLSGQVQQVVGALAQMTAGVATSNKTMFNINKAAGIATAVVNTYVGASQALRAYPPPLSFIMAAAQIAAGVAQVSAIRSTQFGSGTTPSVAGSTPTFNGQPTTPIQQPQADDSGRGGAIIQITVNGSLVGDEGIKEILGETLKEAVDLDEIIIAGDSRQAEAIRTGSTG